MGLPAYKEAAPGKKAKKSFMNIATGQMRLFGTEADGADPNNNIAKPSGKRIITRAPKEDVKIFDWKWKKGAPISPSTDEHSKWNRKEYVKIW